MEYLENIKLICANCGFSLTINENPTKQEISRILKQIEKNKTHTRKMIDMFNNKNYK